MCYTSTIALQKKPLCRAGDRDNSDWSKVNTWKIIFLLNW